MSLIGDRRRWRLLDRMKAQRERETLEYELHSRRGRILEARKIKDSFRRRLALSGLMPRFDAVRNDYEMVKAREQSARRDLGESSNSP
jgi:hypothetical protein